MRLLRLQLENFRHFRSAEAHLASPSTGSAFSVVVGDNGAGKSSLLTAAATVLTFGNELLDFDFLAGLVRAGSRRATVTAELEVEPGASESLTLTWTREQPRRRLLLDPVNRRTRRRLQELAQDRATAFVTDWLDPRRYASRNPFHAWVRLRLGLAPRTNARVVRDFIRHIVPGASLARFDARDLWLRTGDGVLPMRRLHGGAKYLAFLLGRILRANDRVFGIGSNPAWASGVVLIDELEQTLHPDAQLALPGMLTRAFPNLQFLVTTHSPFVAQQCAPGCLLRVCRHRDGARVESWDTDFSTLSLVQLLESPVFGASPFRSIALRRLVEERDQLTASGKDEPRREELDARIRALADGSRVRPVDRERLAALERIEALLDPGEAE